VQHRHRPGEVREEDEARLQRPHEDRFSIRIVARDLGAELPDADGELVSR
jgi:hypothetical protein